MNNFIKDLEYNLKHYYQSGNLRKQQIFDLKEGNSLIT